MAVVATTTKMVAGVKYTHTTADSADWASVSNSTYFYDIATEIVYFKDSNGIVQDKFSGSTSSISWGDITGTLSNQTDLMDAFNETIEAVGTKTDKLINENAQSGGSYTLQLSDADKLVSMNNGGGNTLTIPNNVGVAYPIGTQIIVTQLGAGATTFSPDAGVTIQSFNGNLISAGQFCMFTLIKRGTNTWVLGGNLV